MAAAGPETTTPSGGGIAVFQKKIRVKGYGYNMMFAKWDAMSTCWKINNGWDTPGWVASRKSGSSGSGMESESVPPISIEEKTSKVEELESQGMKCRHIKNWHH